MESLIKSPPREVTDFLTKLTAQRKTLRPQLEPGGDKLGNWWIDLPGRKAITLEWRPGRGFGLWFGRSEGYGEGPMEIFRTPERAVDRVMQILTLRSEAVGQGLRIIRELYKVSQDEIATRLNIRQAAISKLEGRTDPKIETVSNYVAALGGHVEFRVVFPDGQMPIYWSQERPAPTASHSTHAKIKSRRAVRA